MKKSNDIKFREEILKSYHTHDDYIFNPLPALIPVIFLLILVFVLQFK